MKLSVIVPVYNMAGEGKLEYCLNSLIAQTIPDYEIIAVDDASTDCSLQVLREYEARYPEKIRVITYRKNQRQGGAKNEGLKAASGEWIGFIDSDDWVTPDFYEKLLQRAEETGADIVGCDYSLVDRHTMEVGRIVQNNDKEQTGLLDKEKHRSLFVRPGSMVVKIYRASVIRDNCLTFPAGIFYEDNYAGPLWSLYFRHFERVEEPMYFYYQHQTSTVHYISEEKCRDRMAAAELLYRDCKKRGFLGEYFPELEYWFAEVYYCNTLFSYLSGVKSPRLAFVKELRKGIEEKFPDFQKNPYYRERIGETERKFIALQGKSDLLFLWYYGFKQWVWKLRKS